VNAVIAAGGGTVNIPAGNWECNQAVGGAINIDLQSLPAGAWLNIIGSNKTVNTKTQNGVPITCPATILRSSTINNVNTIGTFNVVGSPLEQGNFNNVLSTNRHIRIAYLTILGNVTDDSTQNNYGIAMSYVDGFLIDHCTIDSQCNAAINSGSSKGVVSSCSITDYYHEFYGGDWGYGVCVTGNSQYWCNGLGTPTWIMNIDSVIGLYNWQGITLNYGNPQVYSYNEMYGTHYSDSFGTTNDISFTAGPVYIENNYFNLTRHPASSSQYGYYVFRFNYVETNVINLQAVDQHGRDFPAGRFSEVYNNTICNADYGDYLRGGGALIFDNNFKNDLTGVGMGNEDYNATGIPYDYQYLNDIWIWNNIGSNTLTSGGLYSSYGVFNPLVVPTGENITMGVNVFTDSWGGLVTATNPTPPKPGYTPLAYPFPLGIIDT
jgi:hypothetical protein